MQNGTIFEKPQNIFLKRGGVMAYLSDDELLERDGLVTVHLDAEQAGVGTATCGPGVLPQYLVPLKKQSFEFTLYPVK